MNRTTKLSCLVLLPSALLFGAASASAQSGAREAPSKTRPGLAGSSAQAEAAVLAGGVERPQDYTTKSTDELIHKAFMHNPDIQLAEAHAREAAVQVRKARMETVRQIAALHEKVKSLAAQHQAMQKHFETGVVSSTELLAIETKLADVKAELEYAVGDGAQGLPAIVLFSTTSGEANAAGSIFVSGVAKGEGGRGDWIAKQVPSDSGGAEDSTGGQASRRAATGVSSVSIDFSGSPAATPPTRSRIEQRLQTVLAQPAAELNLVEVPLAEVASLLAGNMGVAVLIDRFRLDEVAILPDMPISLQLRDADLTWQDALNAITDLYPQLAFVPRGYGLLLTTKQKRQELGLEMSFGMGLGSGSAGSIGVGGMGGGRP